MCNQGISSQQCCSCIQEAMRRPVTRSAVMDTKNGYPSGYPPSLHACELLTWLSSDGKRSSWLHFSAFKPQRFLYLCPFQSDQIEITRLIRQSLNRIDLTDGPFQSPKGAVTGHIDEAVYRQDVGLHGLLSSFLMNQMPSVLCIRWFIPERRNTPHDT